MTSLQISNITTEKYMLSSIETFVLNRMVDSKELQKDLDSISKSITVATMLQ